MENELIEANLNKYFIIEYDEQNLDTNPKYLNWKESMTHEQWKKCKIYTMCKR